MQSVVEICWRHICCRTQCTERIDFEESTILCLSQCRGRVESERGTIPYRTQCRGRIQDSEGRENRHPLFTARFWRLHHTFWSGNQILNVAPYLLTKKSNSEDGTIPSEEEIKFWRWYHTFWRGYQILNVAPYLVGLNVKVDPIGEFQIHKLHRVQSVVGAVAQGDKGGVLHCHDPQQVTRFTPRSPEQHTLIRIGGWTTWDTITRTYVLVV